MSTKVARKLACNLPHPYIEQKIDTREGRPILRGTRIGVSLIAWQCKQGRTVDEILQHYPHLTPAQVAHDALSYDFDHQSEIEEEIRLDQDHAYWMKSNILRHEHVAKIKLYLDEDVESFLADVVHRRGYEATTTRDCKILGLGDTAQVSFARRKGFVILTYNVRHFPRLLDQMLSRNEHHPGFIIARQEGFKYPTLCRL